MNVYDSERMGELLEANGYKITEEISQSDIVILNTCNIREKAAEKIYSELGRIKKYRDIRKESGLETIIAIAGCVAQAEGDEIKKGDLLLILEAMKMENALKALADATVKKILVKTGQAVEKNQVLIQLV